MTGYFYTSFLGLPLSFNVDSILYLVAVSTCHFSLPNGARLLTELRMVCSSPSLIGTLTYSTQSSSKVIYVDEASHWRYSSARDYEGEDGLIEIERYL